MKTEKLYVIAFSPTGTSRAVASAIASGTGICNTEYIDLGKPGSKPEITLPENAVAVISVPVYGGMAAPVAMERLAGIKGVGTPAVLVAVYGNRSYGKALEQLSVFAAESGFVPVAAGAFVGEHSYSTPSRPIAEGRPDGSDIACAEALGRAVSEKLSSADGLPDAIDVTRMKRPPSPVLSVLRFMYTALSIRRRQKKNPVPAMPVTDAGLCTHCGRCVRMCPTGAIEKGRELFTDSGLCIKCCACVKGCPSSARTLESPYARVLSECFSKRKAPAVLV